MSEKEIILDDVRVYYDKEGRAREVLMSYETFAQLRDLLREREGDDQAYFWTEEWQARIQEAEADIAAGRVKRGNADNIDELLNWLDE